MKSEGRRQNNLRVQILHLTNAGSKSILPTMKHTAVKQIRPDKFIVVCAWCPDAKEAATDYESMGYTVSHGICPKCREKFHADSIKGGVLDLTTISK
jgi:hypothetical protein